MLPEPNTVGFVMVMIAALAAMWIGTPLLLNYLERKRKKGRHEHG